MLSIQFHLSTRLPSVAPFGRWPDEYHVAATRLVAAFDALDRELAVGDFRLQSLASGGSNEELTGLREKIDSLTYAPLKTSCPFEYIFNQAHLLCGKISINA